MSVEVERPANWSGLEPEVLHYRAVSPLAVASCIVGVLSVLALLDWMLLAIIPPVGILTGVVAWRKIRQHPDELTGERIATIGLSLSLAFLVLGGAWQTYAYVTEFPAEYRRISYDMLQPDKQQTGQIVPPAALDLDGQRVGIKGYAFPGRESTGIREFLLVWNNGDCCFGGNPPLTHKILVKLQGPLTLTYSRDVQHVAGTFHVIAGKSADGQLGVVYQLDADYLK